MQLYFSDETKSPLRSGRAVLIVIGLLLCAAGPAMAQVSRPGAYSGYSAMIYAETVRSSHYVPMRDGTRLAVDLLRPAKDGIAVNTPYPVLWLYNWGGRAIGGAHAVDNYAEIVKYGYVVAFADARGTGASFGAMTGSYARIEAQDAYDLTEWLGAQPWSNGKVGMMGCSHSGQIEWLAAAMKPPHLKAIFPQCYSFDYYFGKSQGGIPGTFRSGTSYDREKTSAPVDEDPTGAMRDEAVEQTQKGPVGSCRIPSAPFPGQLLFNYKKQGMGRSQSRNVPQGHPGSRHPRLSMGKLERSAYKSHARCLYFARQCKKRPKNKRGTAWALRIRKL